MKTKNLTRLMPTLLLPLLMVTVLSGTVLSTADTCGCGEIHFITTSVEEDGILKKTPTPIEGIWTELSNSDNLINLFGNYYLSGDLAVSEPISISSEVNLCLNGYSIVPVGITIASADIADDAVNASMTTNPGITTYAPAPDILGDYAIFTVGSGGTLRIFDGGTSSGYIVDDPIASDDATITITGGLIGGSAYENGAVYVFGDGLFELYGGSIAGNSTRGVNNGGTFNMYGGTITGNAIGDSSGGGVSNSGTFNMYDGVISMNYASSSGGGVYSNATFTMYGGAISDNEATDDNGGGVNISADATFTLYDGTITGNEATASNGGGVSVSSRYATFKMEGGIISDSTARNNGGGVYSIATVTMTGGTITGNAADGGGDGVYALDTVNLSGSPVITANDGDGLYVPSGAYCTISDYDSSTDYDALTTDASIYVTLANDQWPADEHATTQISTNGASSDAKYFSTASGYHVAYDDTNEYLVIAYGNGTGGFDVTNGTFGTDYTYDASTGVLTVMGTIATDASSGTVEIDGTEVIIVDGTVNGNSSSGYTVTNATFGGIAFNTLTVATDGTVMLSTDTTLTIGNVLCSVDGAVELTTVTDGVAFGGAVSLTYSDTDINVKSGSILTTSETLTLSVGSSVTSNANSVTVASGTASFDGSVVTGDSLTIGEATVTLGSGSVLTWVVGDASITIPENTSATVNANFTVTGSATVSTWGITTKNVTLGDFAISNSSTMSVTLDGVVTTTSGNAYTISPKADGADSITIMATADGTLALNNDTLSVGGASIGDYTYTGLVIDDDSNLTASGVTASGVTLTGTIVNNVLTDTGTVHYSGALAYTVQTGTTLRDDGTATMDAITIHGVTYTAPERGNITIHTSGTISFPDNTAAAYADGLTATLSDSISIDGTTVTASAITLGETVFANASGVSLDMNGGTATLPTDSTITTGGVIYTITTGATITATVDADGNVTLTNGTTLTNGDYTINAGADGKSTINADGTMDLTTGATVGDTTAVGTVTVASSGMSATTATVNGYKIEGADSFAINNNGTVTLTAGATYTVSGVAIIVPNGDTDTTVTLANDGIQLEGGTVAHGFALTGGVMTSSGVTATTATIDDAVFTGDLTVTATGLSATGAITAIYGSNDDAVEMAFHVGATVSTSGKVTASTVTIHGVTYSATGITITVDSVVTYPKETVITHIDGTKITLGAVTTSIAIADGNYPAATTVNYGDNTIILGVDGTIDTENGKSEATEITVNGTTIASTSGTASVTIATGVTTVIAGTVTTNGATLTVANGKVNADGDVTDATSIKVGATTVTGVGVSATADGTTTASVDDEITDGTTTVKVATGQVIVTSTAITMTRDDSLTYETSTIKATGDLTLESGVNLPTGATVQTGDSNPIITVKTAPAIVISSGTVGATAVTVDGVTITAIDTDGKVVTNSSGVTTSESAVTISKTGCAPVTVTADKLTNVSATGTITVTEVTIGGTVFSGDGTEITMGKDPIVTLTANGTIKANGETYTVTIGATITADSDGIVSVPVGATLTKDTLTINASEDTTINDDGTMTLTDGAKAGNVTVAGTATYANGTVNVEGANALTYGITKITAGTVTVTSTGVTANSASVGGYEIEGEDSFAINSDGTVTLTAQNTYKIEGVEITPALNMTMYTTDDGINIAGTTAHGYFVSSGTITTSGVTAPEASKGDAVFKGDLIVTKDGLSVDATGTTAFTVCYDEITTVTLDKTATADADGVVTASEIKIDGVTYTADTGDTIKIATVGVATYPADTAIVDGETTITLGDAMLSTATAYPAETTVVNDGNTITLDVAGTISGDTVSAEKVTVNGTTIASTSGTASVTIATGVTTVIAGTVTTNGATLTVANGKVNADGDVTDATSIKVGNTTVTGVGVSATADGTITASEDNEITDGSTTVKVASGQVIVTSTAITMTRDDSLTYENTTITATGALNVTMDNHEITVSAGATVRTSGEHSESITVGTSGGTVDEDGTVNAHAVTVGGTTIIATEGETVITTANGETTATNATVNGYEIVGTDSFTVDAEGEIALTDGKTYDVENVRITASTGVTMTTATNEITITGTVIYGNYTLTNAEITNVETGTGTLTTTVATLGDAMFTGDLTLDADGIDSTSAITATYEDGTIITLNAGATVDENGAVTASEITIDGVIYTADGDDTITVTTNGVATYPADTAIVDGDYTITLGDAMLSTATAYPAETTVVNGDDSITLNVAGTVDTDSGTISVTQITINGVAMEGSTAVTVDTATGVIAIPATSTITVGDEAFIVTNETEVTVDAFTGAITIPFGTVLEKGDATITVSDETVISHAGVVTLPMGSTVSNNDETVTLGAEGTYTAENAVESAQVTLSDGTTQTTITTPGATTVTVDVDREGATATIIPVGATITNGSSTVTTVTENITVSATDGTIAVPEGDTIATHGMEITMGTDGSSFTLSDTKISLPEGSTVQDTASADAPVITIADGATGATVHLVTTATQSAGTVSATKVTVGETVLSSTKGDLTITLTGEVFFPMGGTVTTTDEDGNETVKNVSTNGSATVSGDGTMRYPSTGSGASSYASHVSNSNNGSVSVSASNSASGSFVTINAIPDEGYEVASVTVTYASGREVTVTANGDGTYSYLQPGAGVTVTVTFVEKGTVTTEEEAEEAVADASSFTDVSPDTYYYDAMVWAVENSITSGYADDTFRATASCTRAQAVTFLWRAAGEPEATMDNPFSDLDENTYYYDAVLWAVENGITTGYGNASFGADATCNRGAIVTFLYRLAGEPEVDGVAMSDVTGDAYYYNAVLWAVENGITTGYNDGTFQSNATCNRGAIVTFLYRYLG